MLTYCILIFNDFYVDLNSLTVPVWIMDHYICVFFNLQLFWDLYLILLTGDWFHCSQRTCSVWFNSFKCTEACFMTQNMAYLSEITHWCLIRMYILLLGWLPYIVWIIFPDMCIVHSALGFTWSHLFLQQSYEVSRAGIFLILSPLLLIVLASDNPKKKQFRYLSASSRARNERKPSNI